MQGSVRITAKTVSVVRATNEPLIPTESTVNLKGNQFIAWYCSEPRLAYNGIVVVRYRCTWSRGISLPIPSTSNSQPRTNLLTRVC